MAEKGSQFSDSEKYDMHAQGAAIPEPAMDPYLKQLQPLQYYTLKSVLLELALRRQHAQQILNTIETAQREALRNQGLDPDLQWTLTDTNCTAIALPATSEVL